MEKFLSLCLSGLVTGAIYSLIAAGLTLSYSATGIFNFSYGAVAFCSAFVYYELHSGLHWPIVPAAIVTIGVFAPYWGRSSTQVFSPPWPRDRAAGRGHRRPPDHPAGAHQVDHRRAGQRRQVPHPPGQRRDPGRAHCPIGPVPRKNYHIFGHVTLDSNQVIVFIAAAVVAVALWYLMRHTPLGLQMGRGHDRASPWSN